MRARLAIVFTLLALAGMAWIESRNRYVETNTGVLPAPKPAKAKMPHPLRVGEASNLSLAIEPTWARGVRVLTVNPDGSSSWKDY